MGAVARRAVADGNGQASISGGLSGSNAWWSHHEKLIVVDQVYNDDAVLCW